jgi:hypothetical protein
VRPAARVIPGRRRVAHPGMTKLNRDVDRKTFFMHFVDAIFTTLFERPFTNAFDVMAQTAGFACVYLPRTTG